ANILLDRVTINGVNDAMSMQGFTSTRFERRLMDGDAQERGMENKTSADDLAQMLYRLWQGEIFGKTVDDNALKLLRERGVLDVDWMGRGLPAEATLLHINGTLTSVRNDAGIVEY